MERGEEGGASARISFGQAYKFEERLKAKKPMEEEKEDKIRRA